MGKPYRRPMRKLPKCKETGKVRFDTKVDAEIFLAFKNDSNPKRREVRSYVCHRCRGWHVTSQPEREK